ncbi:hypothetical protein GE061_009967 [Apolygus lucorum]|uniref:Guanylate cyclase domain-containing protein n=1 Tax=Apolygus lucorum TaxID=248454 RepID=A0A8S9Y5V3_APOLU|nr:hypothetical protein GE061_009967 [Apolygus lucorum]
MHYHLWRKCILNKDSSSKKEEVKAEKIDLLNWTAHIFSQSVAAEESWDNSLGRGYLSPKQIAAVGTFLPEELITLINTGRRYTTLIGAVMIADISGFTTLCETYAKFGPEGAFLLTAMLNSYIGAMVDLIYTFGGDLLKFAGDAFIAIWHCRLSEFLSYKVHEAISCAMHIQYSLGSYQTDVGVMLKVKIAVSAGNFVFSLVGDEFNSSYIIYGYPVLEAKKAEGKAESGDTIVAPSAWNFVSPRDYSYETILEGYVKMKRILYDPRVMTREVFDFDARQLVEINIKNETLKNLTRKTDLVSSTMTFEENIRPNLFGPAIRGISEELRPFVIAPVMQQIDANSSFEYLTEMRQVTIMFLKMTPNTTLESSVIKLTDMVYCTISKIVKSKLGLINKVCMFDKDIMYLVIFGMKGFKEKDEALRCVRCAYQIHATLESEELIKSLSTGITIGTTYCGVVGHPFRKEYTVIGGAVNRAARLMCAFDKVISCDHPVVLNSKLPLAYFIRLPPKYLKGIGQVTNIYQYEEKGLDATKIPPILGRTDVLSKYRDILMGICRFKGIIIMGDPRCGKTRLLSELVEIAEALSWKSIWISVHTTLRHGICLLHKVFANMLGRTIKERMATLIKLYSDDPCYEYLYVLNDIFDVNFAFPYKYVTPLEMTPLFLFRRTLKLISVKTVILIDDAHGLDHESWSVFLDVIQHPKYVVVLSLPGAWQNKQPAIQKCLNSPKVITFYLETLNVASIPGLICQMLNVEAVPRKLVKVLVKLSRGNPGWVQTFLLSYIESGFIVIKLSELSTLSNAVYIIPDKSLLRPVGYTGDDGDALTQMAMSSKEINTEMEMLVPICKIQKQLDENALPATFDDVIMSMFDRQSSFEQLLLKCASVLGSTFFRSDLIHVMGGPPEMHVAPAIKRLFQLHVLGCAAVDDTEKADETNKPNTNRVEDDKKKEFNLEEIKCKCKHYMDDVEGPVCMNYAYCKNPGFKFSVFCTTINATIPMNQKIDFHARALQSIKLRSTKCDHCRSNECEGPDESKKVEDSEEDDSEEKVKPIEEVDDMDDDDDNVGGRPMGLLPGMLPGMLPGLGGGKSGSGSVDENTTNLMKELAQFRKKAAFAEKDEESDKGSVKQERNMFSSMIDCVKKIFLRKKYKVPMNYYDIKFPREIKCTCFRDLSDTYEQLVHHARMAELLVTELKYLIAFAIHSLKYTKYEKALLLLKEAENTREQCIAILNQDLQTAQDKAKVEKKKKSIPMQYMKYTKQQILAYLGEAYLHLGNVVVAYAHLSVLAKRADILLLFWFQMLLMNWPEIPLAYRKKLRREMLLKKDVHMALSRTFLFKNDLKRAVKMGRRAATYARATEGIRHRAIPYTFSLELDVAGGHFKHANKMEFKFIKSALNIYESTSVESTVSMGCLYCAIFKSRYYSGNLMECIEPGEIALKIAQAAQAVEAEVFLLQKLVMAMLHTKNFEKMQEILHPKMYMKEELNSYNHVSKMKLYHRLILEAFLEGSIALENPIRIFTVLKKSVNRHHMNIEHPGSRSNALIMWLWYLRKGEFNRAANWQIPECPELDIRQESMGDLLRIIQCQLLWLESKMRVNDTFSPRMESCSNNLRYLLRIMKKKVHKYTPYLLPRYYHLRAYFSILSYDKFGAKSNTLPGFRLLSLAHQYAERQENILEQAWIGHSRRLWYKPEKIQDPDFWLNHMDDDAIAVEDFENYSWPDIMFSLKVPERIEEEIKRLRSYVSLPDSVSLASSKGEDDNY